MSQQVSSEWPTAVQNIVNRALREGQVYETDIFSAFDDLKIPPPDVSSVPFGSRAWKLYRSMMMRMRTMYL